MFQSDRGHTNKLCLHMQAPEDDELLRYALEGDPLPYQIAEHITECSKCRQQLEDLVSIHHALLHRLYRCRCPNINILARYSAGLASLNEGLLVLYHLHSCPLCTQELQEMRNLLENDVS
jgi:anti-sigma factor ChrR (cupin superfamily)